MMRLTSTSRTCRLANLLSLSGLGKTSSTSLARQMESERRLLSLISRGLLCSDRVIDSLISRYLKNGHTQSELDSFQKSLRLRMEDLCKRKSRSGGLEENTSPGGTEVSITTASTKRMGGRLK